MKHDVDEIRSKGRRNNFDLNRALNVCEQEDKAANNCFYQKTSKSKNKWSNLMMLAEWFMLVPDEFHDDYCMKFCPFGKHVLLVSQRKSTMVFNKNGVMVSSFKSSLPGGGMPDGPSGSAVFDCIFDRDNNRIYIVDIIYYLRQDFREMAARDRFDWLDSFLRSDMASGVSSNNDCAFEVLAATDCARTTLTDVFGKETPFPLDGLLFYNKHGTYVSGSTYRAMWLKPYMVPELLALPIHRDFMANIPMDYGTFRDDIVQYNEKYGWRHHHEATRTISGPMADTPGDGDDKATMDLV